jgi:hypothetical protein
MKEKNINDFRPVVTIHDTIDGKWYWSLEWEWSNKIWTSEKYICIDDAIAAMINGGIEWTI